MTKYIDEFARLTADKMANRISEMTFSYKGTEVPPKHYKDILQAQVIELMTQDNTVKSILLGAILTQLQALEKENKELFFKALICYDLGIKPDKINQQILEKLHQAWRTHAHVKTWLSDSIHNDYKGDKNGAV
ncbi:hypothetical protein NHG25_05880 [Aerococcaceae bacterium NML191292]|nr:hypothetical protein [Aerococcaceae bacterium NML191292]